ncbi:hypothetical protein OVN20_06235 [Microcella daejeonensis]|uniref:hypothetical protein n=1 Tax=Microcella daejeonensis TaxID=2994971 RepID=UPI00227212FE|nr:hypothetical protein [Microcella daejeonensis]WAB85142.1 hypothetical protein OVN20_06235 [Microcella daejeonensis]
MADSANDDTDAGDVERDALERDGLRDRDPDRDDRDDLADRDPEPRALPTAGAFAPRRLLAWAALSGLLVWATQGLIETLGAAILGEPPIGAAWWTAGHWAVGALAQAIALAAVWMLLPRRLALLPTLVLTVLAGSLAHLLAAAGASSAAAGTSFLDDVLVFSLVLPATGAGLVQVLLPTVLVLLPPFLGRPLRAARAPRG